MFDKLEQPYIDGLLCDVTEKAINNWWTEVGAEHYNYEPTDGILGPSTVAALLGMLLGARNRLHWQGAPVSKDVFDLESTKRGISYFQKAQKLEKTRRLDQQTLFKLHTATTKAAVKEDWGVQKAIKSTVTEIGGKRGEIVMDMVSGKDKGGLADVETVDIVKFTSLVYGERPKWLWHGKPRRTPLEQHDHDHDVVPPLPKTEANGQAAGKRAHSLPVEEELEMKRKDELLSPEVGTPLRPAVSMLEGLGERDGLHKTVFKSVAGKMSDARSGFGRFKDGVRGRGHGTRLSISTKEEVLENGNGSANALQSFSIPPSPAAGVSRAFTWKTKPEEYLSAIKRGDPDALPGLMAVSSPSSTVDLKAARLLEYERKPRESDRSLEILGSEMHRRAPSAVPSTADESDIEVICPGIRDRTNFQQLALSRRHSCDLAELCTRRVLNENRWARRMSFGDAEEAVLSWDELIDIMDETDDEATEARAVSARHLAQYIDSIIYGIEPWVKDKIRLVHLLDEKYGKDKTEIQNLHHHLSEIYNRVQYSSEEMLAEERASLTESVKEIEILVARLDYEINALVQKINDVEDGIKNFERQVEDVERRADELRTQLETESWLHWFVRTLTGVGTGPHITRSAS
jgi:hypothetical protein